MTPTPRAEALAFIAAWADYERRALVAKTQYRDMPISFNQTGQTTCIRCLERATRATDGLCADCKEGWR